MMEGSSLRPVLLGHVGVRAGLPKPPQQAYRTDDLDAGVDTEADEGDAAGDEAGADRDDCFNDVPADREVLKAQRASIKRGSSGRGEGLGHDGPPLAEPASLP